MVISTTLIIVAILVIAVWLIIEFQRFRHKILAIVLVLLIIFTYVSFSVVLKGKDVNLKTPGGLKQAGEIYFAWLASIFGNFKTITSNAIHLDWKPKANATIDDIKGEIIKEKEK